MKRPLVRSIAFWSCFGVLLAVSCSRASAGQPQFVVLPFSPGDVESAAHGVSDDGSVIVGWSTKAGQSRPARWIGGVIDFPSGGPPPLPHTLGPSAAVDVSANGQIIIGGTDGMYRWTADSGWMNPGYLGTPGYGTASDVSADGNVVVGATSRASPNGGMTAARWTPQTGLQSLGQFGSAENGALAVSDDGNTVVGVSNNGQSFIWTPATGIQPLGPPAVQVSRASGISGDGKVVVGTYEYRGYRWVNGVMTDLGDGDAVAVSDNGQLVLGVSGFNGSDGWVWTVTGGRVSTMAYLASQDIGLPAGWSHPVFSDMTPDGLIWAGAATNPSGRLQAIT